MAGLKTIDDFKAAFKDGGVRSNLFRVRMFFPTAVNGGVNATAASEFFVKATATPSSNLNLIEIPFMGRMLKRPGERTFPDWTCTVMAAEDMVIRDALEEWSNVINSHEGNEELVDSSQWYQDAEIEMLSKKGEVIKKYTLKDMFPTEIGAFELDMSSTDAISEYTLTFAMHSFSSNTTS